MISFAFGAVLSLGALAVLSALHFLFWGWVYRPRLDSDELLTATAADGWHLAVAHFRPAAPTPGRLPVILCHGLAANRLNMMLPGDHSLAAYFRRHGYEVFVCDLRGVGDSRRPPASGSLWNIDFDHHLFQDAPAVLAKALEVSGAPQAFWVGHSMGGLLGLGLAETEPGKQLAGVVAVASPTHFTFHHPILHRLLTLVLPLGLRGRMHQRWLVRLVAPYLYIRAMVGRLSLNPRNIDGPMLRRVAYLVLDDVSVAILRQFEGWMKRDAWDTRSPALDLRAGLAKVSCPVMLVAGTADVLAPPKAVATTLEELGCSDKVLRVEGKSTGSPEDYGHGDLIFGPRAPTEIFPHLLQWLQAHQPA